MAKKKSNPTSKYKFILVASEINRDPVFVECARLLFDLANKAGLDGKRLTNLEFETVSGHKEYTWITCEGVKND